MRIVAKCRECGELVQYGNVGDYRDPNRALVALVGIEREEIMGSIVNAQWKPADFQVMVKAHDHDTPKDIQAVSTAVRCGACGTTHLYSSRDFYIKESA